MDAEGSGLVEVGSFGPLEVVPRTAEGYNRFRKVYSVKLTRFPNESGEARLHIRDVQALDSYDVALRSKLGSTRRVREERSREERDKENAERVVRRARQSIRHAIRCIEADHLLTLTYRENVTDYRRALLDYKNFTQRVRAKLGAWPRVAVIEYQQRGAIHFHVAVVGYQDVKLLRDAWHAVVGPDGGNIDVQGPKKRFGQGYEGWNPEKLAAYLGKYMGKDFDSTPDGSHRFFPSKDRPRPKVTRFWIESESDNDAILRVYGIVCGDQAYGVRQWLSPDATLYWVGALDPPEVPF